MVAAKRLPEFSGYRGRVFPGQPRPRSQMPEPKRMRISPTFSVEWKQIGSTRFEDLGLPAPPRQRIFVKSIDG